MSKFNTTKLHDEQVNMFCMEVIESFEAFLEEHGITIDNPEKEEAIASGEDPDGICTIYGTHYGILQNAIEEALIHHNLMDW